MSRWRPGRWIFASAVAGVLVLGALTSIQRIPPGHVALDGTRVHSGAWLVHRPFAPSLLLSTPGEVKLPAVRWTTKEGSALEFALELGYTLSRPLAPQLAADARTSGWDRAIGSMAEKVVASVGSRIDTETLLSSPEATEGPLRAALEAAGVHVVKLSLRSGIGDAVVRRTRTQEAQRLARAPGARIVVVGWDGADWNIARPLMAAGRMPNLARFVREGASADLRSYDPMFSPLLWTTVATGKAPTEHGIADFAVLDAKSGDRRPITSDYRKVKALWNILPDFNRRSSWIGWWASYPAESSGGLVVSDYLAATLARKDPAAAVATPGMVNPSDGAPSLAAIVVAPNQITEAEVGSIIPVSTAEYRTALEELRKQPAKSGEDADKVAIPAAFVMRALAATRTYHNIALAQLRAGVPFVAVYFEGIDMMGHSFQHFLPPKLSWVSESDYERYRDAVPHFYELQDRLLGEILSAAGPDAVTLILSDHGFRTGSDRPSFAPSVKGQPEEWHRDWGILALHGPGIRRGALPPASIYDIAPTLLYLTGLPLADDMPGRLVADAFDPAELARRPAAHVRSYELVGEPLAHASAAQADPEAIEEMMANLRALGYVGGSGDEGRPAAGGRPKSTESGASTTRQFYHRNLAVQYIRQGRFADAESELARANEIKPLGKTYEMLSQVRSSQGHYAEAIAALDDGWTRVPDLMNPASILWIVELDLLAGNPAAAKTDSTRLSAHMSPAIRLAIDGRLVEAAGDTPGAIDDYRRALDQDPLIVRTAQRLHDLEIAQGQPFAIEPFLLRTVAAHPEVDAYWDLAGQLALARGENETAVERFRKANALQPDDGLYIGHLASALAASGQPAEARSLLAWADRFPPAEADAWMALGSAWDRLGDPDRAVKAFDAARAAGLRGPGADIGSALALARSGRTQDALRVLDAADARFPSSQALAQVRQRLAR